MPPLKDRTGRIYGDWTVIRRFRKQWSEKAQRYNIMWLCQCSCGKRKAVSAHNLETKQSTSCGCRRTRYGKEHRGSKCVNWKSGRRYHDGYVDILNPEHPRARSNGYIKEHILVMEEKIGRYLYPGENVHHINGIKDDNRPENLELWSTYHPKGQRPIDQVRWAKEILARYPELEISVSALERFDAHAAP